MAYLALPFKAYSEGTLTDTTWSNFNANSVPLAVIAKKAYFSVPANELPNNQDPFGCVWKQHLGQITYFTPGTTIAPAWVCVYLKFLDNFVGQQVKIVLNNSLGTSPIILSDWTAVGFSNGSYLPVFQVCQLTTLTANVNYWVEVLFEKTVNKAPGFYGEDGIEGFLAKYWWSISQAPVDAEFATGTPTDLATSLSLTGTV